MMEAICCFKGLFSVVSCVDANLTRTVLVWYSAMGLSAAEYHVSLHCDAAGSFDCTLFPVVQCHLDVNMIATCSAV